MVTAASLRTDVQKFINEGGLKVRFRYFSVSGGSASYDDDVVLTQSGTDYWTSGLFHPVGTGNERSSEAFLVEQGKLLNNDSKLYVLGDVNTSGTFKVQIGSPTSKGEFSLISDGVVRWDIGGVAVYQKLFIRYLTNGSILGE